MMVFSAC
jgi:hypothetical protein